MTLSQLRKFYELKNVERTARVGQRRESPAEHTWSALILADYVLSMMKNSTLNRLKVYELLLYHDVVEIEAGDVNLLDEQNRKHKAEREKEAAHILKKHLPFLDGYSEEDVYRYFNMVKRSLIRVDADELTYNFHIVLRYEVEKKLISGDLPVSEVPGYWNEKMEEFVGVRPKDDAEGVLQDIHWSGGGIGYFPTYSLGNVIAGMIRNRIQKDISLKETVKRGEVAAIKTWLREHIHKLGGTYSPKELQRKLFGETYNPQPLVNYLEQKYLE
jgi:Zn-dependent M32 family carboxypeptidase